MGNARRHEKTNGHDQKMIECLDTYLPRIKPIGLLSGLEMLLSPIARHSVLPWESRVRLARSNLYEGCGT